MGNEMLRLLKSAEDYLDQPGGSGQKGRGLKSGREVPSWREGHPQGKSTHSVNPINNNSISNCFATYIIRRRLLPAEDQSPAPALLLRPHSANTHLLLDGQPAAKAGKHF
jgi:hypothetical protein